MIFHQHITTPIGEIWIVDATENGFKKSESESRQEFEARVLCQVFESTIGNVELSHSANGAPFIKDRPELSLSISHSENWFSIYVSKNQAIGIDIEIRSKQTEKIQHHFLSNIERNSLELSTDNLQIFWGVKESIVKYYRGKVNDFQHDIQIESMSENDVIARYESKLIRSKYIIHRRFVLVYTI